MRDDVRRKLMRPGMPSLDEMIAGGKPALARALSLIEARPDEAAVIGLLDAAHRTGRGHVLGLTGTPGVGKSTLVSSLLQRWRGVNETVGVVAVDPSSRLSGGALLGDRARIAADPEDDGVFIRSLAARDRLGGLSDMALRTMVLMRAVYDHVLIESVGIGQSEADVAFAADTVVLCIQPGAGDALQFMKAGVIELPHVVAVTKADIGALAVKARADVEGALTLQARDASDGWTVPVVLLSAARGHGLDALCTAIAAHRHYLAADGRLAALRRAQGQAWLADAVRSEFGRAGETRFEAIAPLLPCDAPFAAIDEAMRRLRRS